MPNSFITIQEIARNTLPRLLENLVFPNLIHKDFSNDFSRNLGDTIQVRKPVVLEAKEFDQSQGVTAQDITETSVPVKLDKIATVDVEITAIQGAVNINDLNRQFLEPAAVALAQKLLRRYAGEPDAKKAMAKLMAAMARRGYDFESAHRAVEQALEEAQGE